MREGWKEVKLGDTLNLLNGYAFKSKFFTENQEDIVLIKGSNLGKGVVLWDNSKYWTKKDELKFSKYLLKSGDVLLAMDRPWVSGGLKFASIKKDDPKSFLVQRIACLRTNDKMCQNFLKYVIASHNFSEYIKSLQGGVGVPHISPKQIKSYKFSIPPLQTQRQIASILSAYDDLIENNLKRIKLLEEQAQLTYEEWFVRMKFPEYETAEFDVESGLPVRFNIERFEDHFTINNGYAFKSKNYKKEGIKILRTRDYSQTKWVNIDQPIFISNKKSIEYQKYYVKQYDLMLIMVGASIGNYGIVLPKDLGILQNQNQWAIRAKKNDYDLYKILMMENLIKTLINKKTGAARDFFRASFLKEMSVVIPDQKIIRKFNEITNPIFSNINNLFSQNQRLKEARDILLPRLMTGMIDVEDI